MATLALVMMVVFLILTIGVRVAVQLRRTGSTGLVGVDKDAGLGARLTGLLFLVANVVGVLSPILVSGGSLHRIGGLDTMALHVAGIAIATAGVLAVFGAQMAMGASWRVGVDEEQSTDLVTDGIFAFCRNPIYTAMVFCWVGFALMVPTVISIAAVVLVALALELQVRVVEEPFLRRSHGEAFSSYAARVGRFLPGLGRAG